MIELPCDVKKLIHVLEKNGYESYIVGGCVRDLLLGKVPHDWDIATGAPPEAIMACFKDKEVIPVGVKYGTVLVLENGIPYEITTFRIEKDYSDKRHPGKVIFTDSLYEDLGRRDFTVNALAYHPQSGLIDYFEGKEDLEKKIIRAIGNPDDRFNEDALRVLRALRFASVLGFEIEKNTADSIQRNKDLLKDIAIERVQAEFCKLVCGDGVKDVLLKYADVIAVFIPEIRPMFGFKQKNPHHYLDVWEHTVETVAKVPQDLTLRLTMFFHDIGKPGRYFEDEKGRGHFCGHPKYSRNLADEIMKRMKFDHKTIDVVGELVRYHDVKIDADKKQIKRLLNKIGEERFRQLYFVKQADISSQSPKFRRERLQVLADVYQCTKAVLAEAQCFQRKDLAIDGSDLLAMGIPQGVLIGRILNHLLELVLNDEMSNDRQSLLAATEQVLKEQSLT